MDINHSYWEENSNIQHLKYESCNSNDGEHPRMKDEPLYRCCDSNLNFATVTVCSEDDSEYNQYKKNKVSRQDPMSHRIIEKRRRDRMNNCLADLSRLIPAEYLKKGRGRIEKTEIIEMAIRHIKYMQQAHRNSGREQSDRNYGQDQFRLGYQECMSETMRFLVEVEGYFAREALCVKLINHLQKHCDTLLIRDCVGSGSKMQLEKDYSQPSAMPPTLITSSAAMNSTTMCPQSPMHQYENSSQLRDMLTGSGIKDEIRICNSPQILRPLSPVIREEEPANVNVPSSRIQTLENEKQAEQYKPNIEEQPNRTDDKHNSERTRNGSENENCSNGVSLYKFKTNIKQRFSKDLSAETNQSTNKMFNKRRKVETTRRNSLTNETYSSENHSSPIDGSQCSPPSSELYRISSESENARISPTGSSVSDIRNIDHRSNRHLHLKPENNIHKPVNGYESYSPAPKHNYNLKNNMSVSQNDLDKGNFSVPIFALHAKGSFYIPLTIDYHTLVPYLQHQNILDMFPNIHNIILHPVTINVNFQSNYYNTLTAPIIKPKQKLDGQNGWH